LPSSIKIIDSGEAVARQTKLILEREAGLNTTFSPFHTFLTNSSSKVLEEVLNHKYEVKEAVF